MPRPLLLFIGLTLTWLLPCAVSAQEQTFTAQHVAKLRVVTSAVISPDGTQVAYVLNVPRNLPKEKDGPSWAELHVVDAKGTSTPFITGPVNIGDIAWTPDGKSISFLAKRDKDEYRALYVIPMRGGESRKVLGHGSDIQSYSWSPTGDRVAFLATQPTPKDRKARQDQGFNQEIYEEDLHPVRVWIATLEASAPRMLKLEGSASELHWNPKEEKIAVALAPTPLIDDQLMFRKVHIVDIKTSKATNLNNPGKLGQVAWSPDGKKLAAITAVDKHDPKEGRLWIFSEEKNAWKDQRGILDPKTGKFRVVTKEREGWYKTGSFEDHVESIAWKDSEQIYTQYSAGVNTGVSSWKLGTAFFLQHFDTILSNVTASKDGEHLALIGHTSKHSPEVYYQTPGKEPRRRRLTDSNPWLKTMRFAEQEVVKYKARDGLELEGILVRPLDEKKDQRYPLVVTVHGGPEAHISNGWTTLYHSLGQVGAAKGMAVFYPNYRGSTGRGVEFSMLGQKEAAGKEFDDLVDGVDHLVKTGLVDDKKVGITGGSYGGYATAWGSTYYSDRFAAGVMFVGISDSVSKVGTTDIPQEMFLVHHRKWLWDDWDYFLKSSPIYHTDKAKTPLLIMHGKVDPRVHPSQSLELHRHLKIRGKAPVRLVLYPGEGHGNRRAASRLDYNLRMLQWMEHYLKGPGGAPPPHELDYGLAPPPKTSAASWRSLPQRAEADRLTTEESQPAHFWSGRGCPCCIGW